MKHVISQAIAFAVRCHQGQFDKAGQPYILHPLKVMYLLKSDDEELMSIAVTHDTIEDCFADDEKGFSELQYVGMTPRVIAGVRLLTKNPQQSYEDYIAAILTSRDAICMKMTDVRHNMDLRRLKGITEKDLTRIAKYTVTYHKLKAALENSQ
ncbi:hypothetical protein [Mesorhizobium loti]|uniref:hypothetical protein n=1 Tax=Rhizobium loti TaxID=381 RepID=UPI000405D705|nr:hypothetical protein [Mesorhizobium loti]